jgi:hypothetical protein
MTVAIVVAPPPAPAAPEDDTAQQDPAQPDTVQPDTVQPDTVQHNVTYRARVDGLARGALITYRINDNQVSSTDPTMLPGRTFEATAVLSDADEAGMRISIQWPYSANLVCEILVDDQTVAAASTFISPRVVPVRDDPDYGALNCGAPLSNATGVPMESLDPAAPVDTAAPVDPAASVDPASLDPAVGPTDVPLPGTAVDPPTPPLN